MPVNAWVKCLAIRMYIHSRVTRCKSILNIKGNKLKYKSKSYREVSVLLRT